MKDFLGQKICIGDDVVYPNRQSSAMWMVKARVIEVRSDSLRVERSEDGTIKTITRVDRVTVVTEQISYASV